MKVFWRYCFGAWNPDDSGEWETDDALDPPEDVAAEIAADQEPDQDCEIYLMDPGGVLWKTSARIVHEWQASKAVRV